MTGSDNEHDRHSAIITATNNTISDDESDNDSDAPPYIAPYIERTKIPATYTYTASPIDPDSHTGFKLHSSRLGIDTTEDCQRITTIETMVNTGLAEWVKRQKSRPSFTHHTTYLNMKEEIRNLCLKAMSETYISGQREWVLDHENTKICYPDGSVYYRETAGEIYDHGGINRSNSVRFDDSVVYHTMKEEDEKSKSSRHMRMTDLCTGVSTLILKISGWRSEK